MIIIIIEAKSLYDQINSRLIGSIISVKKKHGIQWQSIDYTFSVVYSLLNIKSKAFGIYLKISLKFLEICSEHVFAWV